MKNKFLKIIFLVVTVGLVIWFWPTPKQHSSDTQNETQAIQSGKPSVNIPPTNGTTSVAQAASIIGNTAQQRISDIENTNLVIHLIEGENSPITFFGKVIDQNGDPVSGVKATATIRQWYVKSPVTLAYGARFIPVEKESDSSGRFEINGKTGDSFGIEFTPKDGYSLSPTTSRGYGTSSGSFENPVIIKMWKEGTKEPLIGGSHVFGIDSGKIYTLDLLEGKKIEGETVGDLRVSITRPNDINSREKFSWSFSIEVIGGGLVEAPPDDEFMYLAPELGYQPKFEMQFEPKTQNWLGTVKRQFFIRSRNGQVYGRIQMEVIAIYNRHSAIEINYAVNPAGSRNLQP